MEHSSNAFEHPDENQSHPSRSHHSGELSHDSRNDQERRSELADLLDSIRVPDEEPVDSATEHVFQPLTTVALDLEHMALQNGQTESESVAVSAHLHDGDEHDGDEIPTEGLPASSVQSARPSEDSQSAPKEADRPSNSQIPSLGRKRSDSGHIDSTPASSTASTSAFPASTARSDEPAADLSNDLQSAITIKGRSDGVSIEVGRGGWKDLMVELTERLRQASGFFRGGNVTLNVGMRPLQQYELIQIRAIIEQFGMTLSVVRSSSEQTCQVAIAQGLAANLESADGLTAQQANSNHEVLQHFVYRGNIRSGQILQRAETIIIMGDVNPGSQVISQGDILVWGRLRGIAHAGAGGDGTAVIAALSMTPTQLRIGDVAAVLPEDPPPQTRKWRPGQSIGRRPEIAYSTGGQIIVEPWDESKPGGIMAFRR